MISPSSIDVKDLKVHFPVKKGKKPRRQENLTVFLFNCNGKYALCRREDSGLLAGLWEFPNVPGKLETAQALELKREKANKRKAEAAAHRRNVKTGKRRTTK